MPRANNKNVTEKSVSVIRQRLSSLADRITMLERDLNKTRELIQRDMKKLIDMVGDK
jgi:hypothetical protein